MYVFQMVLKKLIAVVVVGFSLSFVMAQSPTIRFVPVAPETLSSAFVRCISKDSRGLMWFGTANGLYRYDGTNMYRYEQVPGDYRSISDNRINVIAEDAQRNLWIGTGQGLLIYDRTRDNFMDIDSIPGMSRHLSNRYITAVSFDRAGRAWIGTLGHGLNVYDPKTQSVVHLAERGGGNRPIPSNFVTSLLLVDDVLWVGTKGGLKRFDTRTTRQTTYDIQDTSVSQKEITQVVVDKEGSLWLSTVDREIIKLTKNIDGFAIIKTRLETGSPTDGAQNILTMCFDAENNLWIGGENSGLNYMDTELNSIVHFGSLMQQPDELPTNSVRSVFVDDSGTTWIGTYNRGIFRIDNNSRRFEIYKQASDGGPVLDVKSLVETADGNVWMAADGAGLVRLDATTREIHTLDDINRRMGTYHLSALLLDGLQNLWIGTWGRGAFKLNLGTMELKHYDIQSNGFGDGKVMCLYKDKTNQIWIGSGGSGLFRLDRTMDRFLSINEHTKPNHVTGTSYVTSILETGDGSLWVGTLFGMFKLTPDQGEDSYAYERFGKGTVPDAGSNEIQLLLEDPLTAALWIGTGSNGITIWSSTSTVITGIRKQDGLPGNSVKGIITDSSGNIWISSNAGISRFDPGAGTIRNYSANDGFPSNEFNRNAFLVASDGKFYFGSDKGLVVFHPDSITVNSRPPVVYFTDLKLNNQSAQIGGDDSPLDKHISLMDQIHLTHNQRSFTIDFTAISYDQSVNQYCYKLEGFDLDWNCGGMEHRATYTNIDPGDYVLLVKAYNTDGIASDTPARLTITIQQVPWKTWWAISLYILILGSMAVFLTQMRIERIKMKNQLELERLAREKEHELSESKTQFFTDISHELRTPLSLIAMPLESLLHDKQVSEGVKKRLGTIQSSADKLMRLVNELMDFNKLESNKLQLRVQQGEIVGFVTERAALFNDLAERRNIHFGIHSMIRSLEGWFDHDKLEKILVNIISNAFKFTLDNGQINIVINSGELPGRDQAHATRCLELVVVDNGIGISEEELPFVFDKFFQAKSSAVLANPGTGIGLSLTKGLVELHHGFIKAESAPDRETRFVVMLPIDREAFADDEVCEGPGYIVGPEHPHAAIENEPERDEDHDKPFILVVEDNDELRKYIALELSHQFNVLEAKDGAEGLSIALDKTPDLIISDILMPLKSGIELCREVKVNLQTSHIPFILLTAKATVEDQIAGIAIGADSYITKPFSIRFLVAQVNQIIESRQKLYSRFSKDVYLLPSKVTNNELDQVFLQKAIDYITENIQDPQLGVESIAELFSLSRMQAYRKIKALTGKSIVDFIRMVRIKKALELMETHQFTLSEIAYRTGFNSASYFTRCFKDHYGKAPSEYLVGKH